MMSRRIKPGYFLGQDASSLPKNVPFRRLDPHFRSFVDEEHAKRFFGQLAGKVDGLDFVNYWYEPGDADEARRIGELGRNENIDLWAGIRWFKQFRDLPVVPEPFVAWSMDESGRISPYVWEARNHLFDYLNPDAVDWMLDVLEQRYWPAMDGVVNGLILPEAGIHTRWFMDRSSVQSWTLRAYSPYVLKQWREYCLRNDVRYGSDVVDRFPVPTETMVAANPDQVMFVPDDRPSAVPAFTRFIDIPRGPAVWLAWEEFLCTLYHENFVHRVAARVNAQHAKQNDWRGVCYFQMDTAALDYREFSQADARTGLSAQYWPQGRRMGVDLHRLLDDRELTCFITETFPSVREMMEQSENMVSLGLDIAERHNRRADYGVMLHACEHWGAIGDIRTPKACVWDRREEELRWEMIAKHRPALLSFYSVPTVLVEEGPWYSKDAADYFWARLREYQSMMRGGCGESHE